MNENKMDNLAGDRTYEALKQIVKTCNPSTILHRLADALDGEPGMHEYVDTGEIRKLANLAEKAEER
jgi:hypothetical protein